MEHAHREALQNVLIESTTGSFRVKVSGESMVPSLRDGDNVLVRKSWLYLPGDILAFLQGDQIILHRLLGWNFISGHWSWIAKGDNRSALDRPFRRASVVGKVVQIERDQHTWKESGIARLGHWLASLRHYVSSRI
ncbi:MAG TPA: S24/S26 family peptidase [Thermoanaerobaculia bacterium]|nr:S24/S26 family peptidase [Thermoanaerobaculia bacterium]